MSYRSTNVLMSDAQMQGNASLTKYEHQALLAYLLLSHWDQYSHLSVEIAWLIADLSIKHQHNNKNHSVVIPQPHFCSYTQGAQNQTSVD